MPKRPGAYASPRVVFGVSPNRVSAGALRQLPDEDACAPRTYRNGGLSLCFRRGLVRDAPTLSRRGMFSQRPTLNVEMFRNHHVIGRAAWIGKPVSNGRNEAPLSHPTSVTADKEDGELVLRRGVGCVWQRRAHNARRERTRANRVAQRNASRMCRSRKNASSKPCRRTSIGARFVLIDTRAHPSVDVVEMIAPPSQLTATG